MREGSSYLYTMQQNRATPKPKPGAKSTKKQAKKSAIIVADNPNHKEDFEAVLAKMASPSKEDEKGSGK